MARGRVPISPTLRESGSDSCHAAFLWPDLTMIGLEWTDSLPAHGLDLSELHRFAAEAAILAGSYLRDSALARTTAGGASTTLHDSIQIKENAADIVTKADMHAEELISGMIRERYPGHKSVAGVCAGEQEGAELTRRETGSSARRATLPGRTSASSSTMSVGCLVPHSIWRPHTGTPDRRAALLRS